MQTAVQNAVRDEEEIDLMDTAAGCGVLVHSGGARRCADASAAGAWPDLPGRGTSRGARPVWRWPALAVRTAALIARADPTRTASFFARVIAV